MNKKTALVGIDPGESQSGVALVVDGEIIYGRNMSHTELMDEIRYIRSKYHRIVVYLEDIKPYNMRLTDSMIRTIKFIGQLELLMVQESIECFLFPRWMIKQWVFHSFKDVAIPRIEKKIGYAAQKQIASGKTPRRATPTFVYVDDWIVVKAMKQWWNIPNGTPRHPNKYGLKDHSWQALALITYYNTHQDIPGVLSSPAIAYSS